MVSLVSPRLPEAIAHVKVPLCFAFCLQLFKAPEFVHKHLVNKHPDKYKAVVDKVGMVPCAQCANAAEEVVYSRCRVASLGELLAVAMSPMEQITRAPIAFHSFVVYGGLVIGNPCDTVVVFFPTSSP